MATTFNFILLLTAFITPLIGLVGDIGYEQSKVLAFLFLTTLAGVFWLNSSFRGQNGARFRMGRIEKLGLFFVLVFLFTALAGIDIWASILGRYPYFQGWIVYAYLFLFCLMVRAANIPLRKWSLVLVLSSLVVAVFAIKDWALFNILHIQIPTYAGRVVSTFGQPNFYSGFLLLSLPFYRYLIKNAEGEKRRLFVLGLIVLLLAILISESRAAILVAGFYFLWLLLVRFLKEPKRLFWILGFGAIVIVFGIFSGIFVFNLLRTEIFEPQGQPWLIRNAPERRSYVWYVVADRILKRPLTGYGLENLEVAFSSYKVQSGSDFAPLSVKNLHVDRAHNYILDILSFSGILGLLAWGVLIWSLLKAPKPPVLAATLILYLLWVQVQNQSIVHLLLFWLVAGLISKRDFK